MPEPPRAAIESQPIVNGEDGRKGASGSLPRLIALGPVDVRIANKVGAVALTAATPALVADRVTAAWALPFPFALTDDLPFANSSCSRASSSAVSWMYEAGGRGISGGGVRGGVCVCVVGGVKTFPGDDGEWAFCGGDGGGDAVPSASYFALSIAFSSAALGTRGEPDFSGLEGGTG